MPRSSPLKFLSLEDRLVPARFGNPWVDARHLTLSFVPDSTATNPGASNLFTALDGIYPREVWQGELLRAFQTWAVEADINIGIVSDSGAALGTPGAPQGDSRFGDIRIGGTALDATILALSSPYDPVAGTRSGDLVVNTAKNWAAGGYDPFTMALQEAGHALGIGNSTDVDSVMYEAYRGPRTGLSAGDVASIQALYGARVADPLPSGGIRTLTVGQGAPTNSGSVTGGWRALEADIATAGEIDRYSVATSPSMGPLVVKLQPGGFGMLRGQLTVSDSAGNVLFDRASSAPGEDLSFRIDQPQGTYTVSVRGVGSDVFSVSGYRVSVQQVGFVPPTDYPVTEWGNNNSISRANDLGVGHGGDDRRYDFALKGSISSPDDRDFFKIRSAADLGGRNTLIVSTWALGGSDLDPQLAVYDANGHRLRAEILMHQNGSTTIQLEDVEADTVYFVRVTSIDRDESSQRGNYFLGMNFTAQERTLEGVVARTVGFGRYGDMQQFDVTVPQVFHFAFSARTVLNLEVERISLVVMDDRGRILSSRLMRAGDTVTFDLYLGQGRYNFVAMSFLGNQPSPLPFVWKLKYAGITDPIGIDPSDGISPGGGGSGSGGSGGTGGGGTGSGGGSGTGDTPPPPILPPTWLGFLAPEWWIQFLGPLDPYGNPWGF